jgi:hypothetical protein
MPEPDGADRIPRAMRLAARLMQRRTARASSRAWLGESVAAARTPKHVAATTRLAPEALPPPARPQVQLARTAAPAYAPAPPTFAPSRA